MSGLTDFIEPQTLIELDWFFKWEAFVIDLKTVERIAHLARLEVSPAQAQEFSEQLSKILGYFEQISKLDTKNVQPLVTPSEIEAFWRDDEQVIKHESEAMVANAPDKIGSLYKVPPVV